MKLVKAMAEQRVVMSCSEARRAIMQGGVRLNNETITDLDTLVQPGDIVQIGKRDAIRIGEEPDSKSGAV